MEIYSPEEVEAIVELVKSNPKGFLNLARKHVTSMPIESVERSMRAWGIPVASKHDESTSNRPARRR